MLFEHVNDIITFTVTFCGSSAVTLMFFHLMYCCVSQEITIMGMTGFCMLMVSSGFNGTT
jgi:hypothetical protein